MMSTLSSSTCTLLASATLIFGMTVQGTAYAADNRGAASANVQQCIACHGQNGMSVNPQFPNLAGQNAAYLQKQLNDFKTGKRQHPIMTPIAKSLSQKEMAALARYYSKLQPACKKIQ